MAESKNKRLAACSAALRAYDFGRPVKAVADFEVLAAEAWQNPALAKEVRAELAAVLDSNAPFAARQAACKLLWMVGPGEAVAALIRPLHDSDTRLAEAAMFAMARTPSAEFDAALGGALPSLRGNALIAAVDLAGQRGIVSAAGELETLGRSGDVPVATAAQAALEKLKRLRTHPACEGGFVPLFDGRTLEGWEIYTPGVWTVRNGVIIGSAIGMRHNDFLRTKRRYGNFTLRLKIRLTGGEGNTGVQFRSEPVPNSPEVSGFQADGAPGFWGALYDESRRNITLAGAGPEFHEKFDGAAWHDYQIDAQGDHIVLTLDGIETVNYRERDTAIPRSGLIALQVHAQPGPIEVWFRNIRIREYPG